jgi:hypothetical protein
MTTTLFEQADNLVKEIGSCKRTIDKLKDFQNRGEAGIYIYFSAYSDDAYYAPEEILSDLIKHLEKKLEVLKTKFKEL